MSLVLAPLILGACNGPDTNIHVGEPELVALPTALDFGEVAVGKAATLTLTLVNEGIGDATVTADLSGNSAFDLYEVPEIVPADGTAELKMTLSPEAEGPYETLLLLDTNDENYAHLEIPVSGMGVIPTLSVSPDTLYFGEVGAGESVTRTTTLTSLGSGTVRIDALEFPNGEESAYAWALPDGATLPLDMAPGYAITLEVTYAPPDGGALAGELVIVSDDQTRPNYPIELIGGEATTGAEPPDLQILWPGWGTRWLDTHTITLELQAVDPDDTPEDLTVLIYVDGSLLETGQPASDGTYSTAFGPLTEGEHTILARAIDPSGGIDEDTVDVTVQNAAELTYTLSGGASVFEYWSVDDDVTVYVDGVEVFTDQNGHQSTHSPLEFDAVVGSTVRIVATDANPCRKSIGDIVLHYGTNNQQALVAASSASSCSSDSDYDASYSGPWPNDFLDETFTISIP